MAFEKPARRCRSFSPRRWHRLPAEIRLTKDYLYRLRGTATVDDRDCWVIDFRPVEPRPGRSLYRGTVWVDREIFARVRTRATQVGLEGVGSVERGDRITSAD